MRLIVVDRSDPVLCHNTSLVCGFSIMFTDEFQKCYKIGNINLQTEVLQEEVTGRLDRNESEIAGRAPDFRFRFLPWKTTTYFENTVPLNLVHPYNYFHFLIEALPTLHFLIRTGIADRRYVIISGALHPNMREAFHLVNENKLRLHELAILESVASENTILIKDAYVCNERQDGRMPDKFTYDAPKLQALKDHLISRVTPNLSGIRSRLFILRQSAQRNVSNILELVTTAAALGFVVIDPSTQSFAEQVSIFSSASVLIGPTGAWLANLMFVSSSCSVHILYPETCRASESIWSGLGKVFDIGVKDHYFPVTKLHETHPIHSDFYVDVEAFKTLLGSI